MNDQITCPGCGSKAHHKDEHGNVVFECGSQPYMQLSGPKFAESAACLRCQIGALRVEVAAHHAHRLMELEQLQQELLDMTQQRDKALGLLEAAKKYAADCEARHTMPLDDEQVMKALALQGERDRAWREANPDGGTFNMREIMRDMDEVIRTVRGGNPDVDD